MKVILKSWDKLACEKEAKKYKTRTHFVKGCASAYNAARINGWLDEVCSHMTSKQKPHGYWTKERCHLEALKYKTLSQFNKGSTSAFQKAKRCNWLDDICGHMRKMPRPHGYWNKERCQEEALKFTSRSMFNRESNSAYSSALRNGWLDDLCNHMN